MSSNLKRQLMLEKLIDYSLSLDELALGLREFEWDAPETLVRLRPSHLINVLRRFIDLNISSDDVRNWAELLEVREDIEISDDESIVWDTVFELATPILFGELSIDRAETLISKLSSPEENGGK